jgi:hypothetical protein
MVSLGTAWSGSKGGTAAAPRDLAVCGAILGIASSAWFGWGQQAPPAGWSIALTVGSLLGLAAGASAIVAAVRSRGPGGAPSAMIEAGRRTLYYQVVGVEVVACLVGSLVLGATGAADYVPAWILFVVGVHFIPLARVFEIRSLIGIGVVCAVVAIAAAVTGLSGAALPSAVAGAGGGLAILAGSVISLWDWRRVRSTQPSRVTEGA